MTQEALADVAGITVSHLSAIEGGHSNPKWSTIRALAAALDVRLKEVATLAEDLER